MAKTAQYGQVFSRKPLLMERGAKKIASWGEDPGVGRGIEVKQQPRVDLTNQPQVLLRIEVKGQSCESGTSELASMPSDRKIGPSPELLHGGTRK
jgi:hypothetical protein